MKKKIIKICKAISFCIFGIIVCFIAIAIDRPNFSIEDDWPFALIIASIVCPITYIIYHYVERKNQKKLEERIQQGSNRINQICDENYQDDGALGDGNADTEKD